MKGTWLLAARIIWMVVLALGVWIMIADIPFYFEEQRTVCTQEPCDPHLDAGEAAELEQLGISMEAFAIYNIVQGWLIALVFITLGSLIFWRRPEDLVAFVTSLLLILLGVNNAISALDDLIAAQPFARWPIWIVNSSTSVFFLLFLFIFPNGRLVPRWAWAVVLIGGVDSFITSPLLVEASPDSPLARTIISSGWQRLLLLLISGFAAQVFRYRRLSTPLERQQTKWVLAGIGGYLIINAVLFTYYFVFVQNAASTGILIGFLWSSILYLSFLLLPISIAFSILRYRLWDIDVLIRKTLVYGLLTATLGLVFFGGVVLMQGVVARLTGTENSPIAIVLSTLAIAALFSPLRRRIQDFIDRRFYRKKYDAAQALEEFAETARKETDLDLLSGKLVDVVSETMQPEQVSLWLKPHRRQK